jgi:hypothetical protein
MTEKTGTIQTTGSLWKLMVVANAEAIVAVALSVRKRKFRGFWEAVETLADESERLWQKVACPLDSAGNENLEL